MTLDPSRVAALWWKDWLEARGTLAPWLPGLLMVPVLALPFVLALVVPALANEPLERSEFADQLARAAGAWPALRGLPAAAGVQALIFQQFLVLTVLVPVSGAMSLAAHGIIGEKQARALEPLLATPLSTLELLLAKVLAALAPALVLEGAALLLYFGAIGALAEPGVLAALASVRTLLVTGLVGPLAALVALQLVVLASTRARDPRSAQQVGVLVVLPLVGLMIAQSAGALWLPLAWLALAAMILLLAWLGLLAISVAAFSREHVLTRWR